MPPVRVIYGHRAAWARLPTVKIVTGNVVVNVSRWVQYKRTRASKDERESK